MASHSVGCLLRPGDVSFSLSAGCRRSPPPPRSPVAPPAQDRFAAPCTSETHDIARGSHLSITAKLVLRSEGAAPQVVTTQHHEEQSPLLPNPSSKGRAASAGVLSSPLQSTQLRSYPEGQEDPNSLWGHPGWRSPTHRHKWQNST